VFGPDIRQVFQTPAGQPLGSTAIDLTAVGREGTLERLVASGSGWGHGVGMCQWGAIGRARAKQNAREIVTAYFKGSRIEGWY
jgi:stage II sporulation protein D